MQKPEIPQLTHDHLIDDPYAREKLTHAELFEPIPQKIGVNGEYPTGAVGGWRDIDSPTFNKVEESGEPLVNIAYLQPPLFTTGDYSGKLVNSGYGDQPLDGSTVAQYVRQGVAEKLERAQKLLPPGYRLVMFDAWRSLETQYATYEMCYESIAEMLREQGVLSEDEEITPMAKEIISKETQKFISLPSPLPESFHQNPDDAERAKKIPSPHNTGGSIDIGIVKIDDEYVEELAELEKLAALDTDPYSVNKAVTNFAIARLYREHSRVLDFGTEFDFASQKSALTYCEAGDELGETARDSRRMLYNVMAKVGFEAYEEEWWHYNCGNQMARMTEFYRTGQGQNAIYGNIELSNDQTKHETLHRDAFDALVAAAENPEDVELPTSLTNLGLTKDEVLRLASGIGHPRETDPERFPQTWDMKYRGELADDFVQQVKAAQNH